MTFGVIVFAKYKCITPPSPEIENQQFGVSLAAAMASCSIFEVCFFIVFCELHGNGDKKDISIEEKSYDFILMY